MEAARCSRRRCDFAGTRGCRRLRSDALVDVGRRSGRRRRIRRRPSTRSAAATNGSTAPSAAPATPPGRSSSAASWAETRPARTQFNPGKDADDLIAAGLMQDLTELATKEDWKSIVRPASQLEGCTKDGKVYCVPVNLHSAQWMWTNRHVYEDAGLTPPKNWDEVVAAAPKLQGKGHPAAFRWRRAGRSTCCSPTTACPASAASISISRSTRTRTRPPPAVRRCEGLRGDGPGPQAGRSADDRSAME